MVEGEGEGEFLSFNLGDDYPEAVGFHRWFAMRGASAARAAVAFTARPDWLRDPERVALVAGGDDAALATIVAARQAGNADKGGENKTESLLDLCAGAGIIGAMASRLGFDVLSLELSSIPHLIGKVLYDFPISVGAADVRGINGGWRGYATEVGEFANAVWRGAKVRLNELFEEDVDIRIWVRFTPCPFCGTAVPIVPNARLSGDAALNIIPDSSAGSGSAYPRFGLLRTEFPDLRGTFSKGFCACPSCRNRFRFQGHELIPLRSVPVAVRTRHSSVLTEIDLPDVYVRHVEMASHDFLAASSRRLGDHITLPDGHPIFRDIRGEPITAGKTFLPRQRAYFAALAESVSAESEVLAKRSALTATQRTSVRVAVALLISGQADYVNTCIHSSIDKSHPSTSAGPMRLGGLFTEVGGFWLERFWQARVSRLLDLLQPDASAARPITAIRANADAIPLRDAAVSAVIWDPPYYDKIDYDAVSGHYQSILAAVLPDMISAPVFKSRLHRDERLRRYEDDLVKQAREARRVVGPNGSIGVFWLAREPAELKRFLELIEPAALQLVDTVRLDTIPAARAAPADQQTYLLVLQPIPPAARLAAVDEVKVLSLAADGVLSLFGGLAELFESVLEPEELDELIADEGSGSSRQRLTEFLIGQEREELLIGRLGRPILRRELLDRGASSEDLRGLDNWGLARRLLVQLGFAVARPVRFSIRGALRECENAARRLEVADSSAAVNDEFLAGINHIETVLRYTVYAWAYLERGDQWKAAFAQVIESPGHSYPGADKLSFGHLQALFRSLPAAFATTGQEADRILFGRISRALKKGKVDQKLSELGSWRNGLVHGKESMISLSFHDRRDKCSAALAGACTALAEIDRQRLLPVTVRPKSELRELNKPRLLSLRDPDDTKIDVYVGSETDLTEPLIYFASDKKPHPDLEPRFVAASVVEDLVGLTARDSRQGRAPAISERPLLMARGPDHAHHQLHRRC